MQEKKVPTLIAIIFLLVAIVAGVFLVKNSATLFSKASAENTPKLPKITNINQAGATFSWLTDKELSGFVKIGEDPKELTQTYLDDRDSQNQIRSYKIHYVTIKNLKNSTKYYYTISSGNQIFDDKGKPFEFVTAASPSGPLPPNDVASGQIITANGQSAPGVIIYYSLANMTPQSALTGSTGNWLLSLNTAFSTNLNTYATYDKEAQVAEIFIQGGVLGTATATVTTKNDNPVPKITLGKTHDFRQSGESVNPLGPEAQNQTVSLTPTPITTSTPGSLKITPTTTPTSSNLIIISPENEENVATQKPNIFGTGPANKTLQIVVQSPTTYSAAIKTDSTGNWTYTPPANLPPGEHTITLTYAGNTITRTFTVLAAESSSLPAFTATPSATLTPTIRPTSTPTIRITVTPTPTTKISATPTPTKKPTATPTTIARTSMPSTASGTPQSGNLTPSLIVLMMGIALIMSSFVVQKLSVHEQ